MGRPGRPFAPRRPVCRQVEAFAEALSEEALFRQRFTVEVEWLLFLAAEPESPSCRPIPPETAATLEGLGGRRSARTTWPGSRTSSGAHQPRRQGRRVLPQGEAGRHRLRPGRRVRALRLHVRGHQQHRPRPHAPRGPGHRLAAARRRPGRRGVGAGRGLRRPADAEPHPRPAGLADHPRQGVGRLRGPLAAPDRHHPSGPAAGQVQRGRRHLRRPRGRLPRAGLDRRCPAASWRASGWPGIR